MQMKDLQHEIAEQAQVLAKLRLDVSLQSEKDTAKLRRLRKVIARMQTVVTEKERAATVPAPRDEKRAVSSAKKNV